MAKKQRNMEIELLRFVFAVMVMLFHYQNIFEFGYFHNGAIGVEFFFLTSGLFMARSAEKCVGTTQLGETTLHFILGKVKAFYPYYLFVVVFQILVLHIGIMHYNFYALKDAVLSWLPQLFLTDSLGAWQSTDIDISGKWRWYLSAMVWGMVILFPILVRWNEFARKILFPLIALLGVGYLLRNYHGLKQNYKWDIICNLGLIRGMSEMAMGVVCYDLARKLKAVSGRLTKLGTASLFLVKTGCYLVVILYGAHLIDIPSFFIALLLLALGLTISYSETGGTLPANRVCAFLGKLSLPIYMCHRVLETILTTILGVEGAKPYVPYLVIASLLFAVMMVYLVPFLCRLLKRISRWWIRPQQDAAA